MSWIAVTLIVASACLHAVWNFVSKRRSPTLAFYFIAAASGALIVLPYLLVRRQLLGLLPPALWLLLIATGVAQAVYFYGLAGAYRRGDLSLAYPLARALPVVAVAAISLLLGRGAEIGRLSLLGMLLVSGGCLVLPQTQFGQIRLQDYGNLVLLMAVVAAVGTTAYTLLDDAALRLLRVDGALGLGTMQTTLFYVTLQTLSTALMIGLITLLHTSERQRLAHLVADRRRLLSGVLTGVIIMVAYGLVLASMAFVRDVSYVAAFRQLSIPIGALLGLTLAQEPSYPPKIVGIIVISIGLILVGVGK